MPIDTLQASKRLQEEGTFSPEQAERIAEILSELDIASATKEDLDEVETRLGERIDVLEDRLETKFESVDERFQRVDERFQRIDERFQRVDDRFQRAADERPSKIASHSASSSPRSGWERKSSRRERNSFVGCWRPLPA